jgi:hypothetical protein
MGAAAVGSGLVVGLALLFGGGRSIASAWQGASAPARAPVKAPIVVTINPEARVSVALGRQWPPPARCGAALAVPIAIVNQGFVTARLEAVLVGDTPAGVTMEFHPEALKGVPAETRVMHLTLEKPAPVDLTIAFRAHGNAPDLGGRDRIHFLVRCRPV